MLNRREFLAAGGGIVAAPTLTGSSFGSATSPAPDAGTMTMLFIDDYYLNRWEKVTRHVGQPKLVPEATFRDPEHWTASGYPTAFRHESGVWRMVYQGKALERPQSRYPLVVESEDGIHWRIPDLSKKISLPGRRFGHQLFPIDEFREWDAYYDDQTENPEERVKGMVTNYGHSTLLWVSPDGLRWTKLDGVRWRPGTPDPPSTAFWNEVRGTYVINALFWEGGEARLNVHSAHEVRVQVTDVDGKVHQGYSYADCRPFKGDELYWTPRWKGGRGLNSFANEGIRLEIELNNARIFAIRGDCIPMSTRETRAFLANGERPVHRPGF